MGVVEQAIRKRHAHGRVAFWVDIELARAGSVRKAAASLGVGYRTLYRWIQANGYTVKSTRTVWLIKDSQRP